MKTYCFFTAASSRCAVDSPCSLCCRAISCFSRACFSACSIFMASSNFWKGGGSYSQFITCTLLVLQYQGGGVGAIRILAHERSTSLPSMLLHNEAHIEGPMGLHYIMQCQYWPSIDEGWDPMIQSSHTYHLLVSTWLAHFLPLFESILLNVQGVLHMFHIELFLHLLLVQLRGDIHIDVQAKPGDCCRES